MTSTRQYGRARPEHDALPGVRDAAAGTPVRLTKAPVRMTLGSNRGGLNTPRVSPAARVRSWISPAWPLQLLLVPFPLWWVLGLANFIFPLSAIAMTVQLVKRGNVKLPPLFWMWALYLAWGFISFAVIGESPPGTHPGSVSGRVISIVVGIVQNFGVTATLVYVYNLPLSLVTPARLARWMGWFFLTVFVGGFFGLLAPHFSAPSALELVLPHHLASNPAVQTQIHLVSAQVQDLFSASGNARPAAPFGFTNSWGYAVSVLGLWFIAGWLLPAVGRRRSLYLAIVVLSFVPIVLSLNRGLWIGIIVSAAWYLGRQAAHGHIGRVIVAGGGAVIVVLVALVATPVGSVVSNRLDNGNSNSIRAYVAGQSLNAIKYSPIVGYGGTRHTNGSASSIAIGNTPDCPKCGDVSTGSTGQLWALLFNNGIGGSLAYFGFFAASIWIYRRERGAINEAALLTIVLIFVYMFVYLAVPFAPTVSMIAVAELARQKRARTAGESARAGERWIHASL